MEAQLNKSMDEELNNIPTAWDGHKELAHWLVKRLKPKVTVELGVDYGYSLFTLAKDNPGQVYGIDLFEGDEHAGARESDQYNKVLDFKARHSLDHVHIIRDSFENQAENWTQLIDILHIDGLHTYEAVKRDFENWAPYMRKTGIILFHDTDMEFDDDFPVRRFFASLPWPRLNFLNSAGLGVLGFNIEIVQEIADAFSPAGNMEDGKNYPISMIRDDQFA